MKRKSTAVERQMEIDDLLKRLHRETINAPERQPFWRQDGWRCELQIDDHGPRLRVFNWDTCVYEEATAINAANTRILELKRMFVPARPRDVE